MRSIKIIIRDKKYKISKMKKDEGDEKII